MENNLDESELNRAKPIGSGTTLYHRLMLRSPPGGIGAIHSFELDGICDKGMYFIISCDERIFTGVKVEGTTLFYQGMFSLQTITALATRDIQ
jgi:hypothetical protein